MPSTGNGIWTCRWQFCIRPKGCQGQNSATQWCLLRSSLSTAEALPPSPLWIYKEGDTIYGRTLRHLSSPFCGPRPTQFDRSPEGHRMSLQHVRWRCVALSAAVLYRIETKDLWPDYNQGELHWRTSLAYTSTFSHWMSLQPTSSSLPFRPWKIIASTQKCEQLTFQLCGVRQRLGNDGSKDVNGSLRKDYAKLTAQRLALASKVDVIRNYSSQSRFVPLHTCISKN